MTGIDLVAGIAYGVTALLLGAALGIRFLRSQEQSSSRPSGETVRSSTAADLAGDPRRGQGAPPDWGPLRPTRFDAVIDARGAVTVLEAIRLPAPRRAVVTVIDDAVPGCGSGDETQDWPERYQPIRVLGRGGMGRVILARDRTTQQLLCVKELFEQIDRRMLQTECRALSRLSHPNIVGLVDYGVETASQYLVTDYVAGPQIHRYFACRRPTEAALASAALPLFEAVRYLHAHGVIHRDLKPENVIMTDATDGAAPILIDFGLAIVDLYDYDGRLTASGHVVGTLPYMAPEQVRGDRLTPACDVYALGVLLWELITGRQPFAGRPQRVFAAKARGEAVLGAPPGSRDRYPILAALVTASTGQDPDARPTLEEAIGTLDRVRAAAA